MDGIRCIVTLILVGVYNYLEWPEELILDKLGQEKLDDVRSFITNHRTWARVCLGFSFPAA